MSWLTADEQFELVNKIVEQLSALHKSSIGGCPLLTLKSHPRPPCQAETGDRMCPFWSPISKSCTLINAAFGAAAIKHTDERFKPRPPDKEPKAEGRELVL